MEEKLEKKRAQNLLKKNLEGVKLIGFLLFYTLLIILFLRGKGESFVFLKKVCFFILVILVIVIFMWYSLRYGLVLLPGYLFLKKFRNEERAEKFFLKWRGLSSSFAFLTIFLILFPVIIGLLVVMYIYFQGILERLTYLEKLMLKK